MRNLKRVLSLALAAMMLIGMMVVGAGAVNAKDFADYDEIKHTEAVSTMVTLNVIDGIQSGDTTNFKPEGTLTRAQMSKIISYVMNGGVEPVLGVKPVPTYSDIDDHWAEKYIEYCTSMGIIAGVGQGKFNPEGTLTGEQAAKMLLTAMGYNAEVFGFVGAGWNVNVNRYANEAGLYEDLGGMDPSQPISRDDACQLAYNAIQAPRMIRSWSQDQTTGDVTEVYNLAGTNGTVFSSLLSEYFNGHIYEGVLVATGDYDLSDTTLLGDGSTTLANSDGFVVNVEKYDSKTAVPGTTPANNTYFEYKDQDLTGLMGQYVKVLYNEKKETVYGIYAVSGKNTVVETYTSAVSYPADQPTKVKIDGTLYNLESSAGVPTVTWVNGLVAGAQANTCNDADTGRISGNKVVFVDNDGNGKFDVALVTPVNVAKVAFLSDTTMTLSMQSADALHYQPSTTSPMLEDVIYPEDLAKDDYVLVSHDYYSDSIKLEALDVQSSTVSGIRGSSPITDYQVDDVWYKVATGYTMPTLIKSGSGMDFVAVNGVLFFGKLTTGATGSKDTAVIYQMSTGAANTFDANTLKAKIVLADGTKKTVTVAKLMNTVDGTNQIVKNNTVDAVEEGFIGQVLTYTVNNDGDYEFTKLYNNGTTDNNLAGYDSHNLSAGVSTNVKDNTLGGTVVADDAVIYLYYQDVGTNNVDNAVKVISGKEFKSIDNNTTTKFTSDNENSILVGKDNDGFSRVRVAAVEVTANAYNAGTGEWTLGVFSGTNYGYLVEKSWTETIDGTKYNGYRIWNGTDTVVMYEEDSTAANLPARSIIAYDVVDDTTIKNVTSQTITDAIGAVEAYSADDHMVTVNGVEYEITNKTVILNVNDKDAKGVDGNAVITAREIGDTNIFEANCYYWPSSSSEMGVLVIDTASNKVNTTTRVLPSANSAALTNALVTVGLDNVVVSGNVTIDTALTIGTDKTVTVKGNVTLNSNLTVDTDAKLVVDGTLDVNGQTLTNNGTIVGNVIGMGSTITGTGTFTFKSATISSGANMIINLTGDGSLTISNGVTGGDATSILNVQGAGSVSIGGAVAASVTVSGSADVVVGNVSGDLTVTAGATGDVTTGTVTGTVDVNGGGNVNIGGDEFVSDAVTGLGAATWSAGTPNKDNVNKMMQALWNGLDSDSDFGFKVGKVFDYSNGTLYVNQNAVTDSIKTWVKTNWGESSVPVAVTLKQGYTAKNTDANWSGAALIWVDLANPASSYTLELTQGMTSVSVKASSAVDTLGAATWSAETDNKDNVNKMQTALWNGLSSDGDFGFTVSKVFTYSDGTLYVNESAVTEQIKTWVNTNWGGTSVPVKVTLKEGFTAKNTDANWSGAALVWVDLANPASSYTLDLADGSTACVLAVVK